MNTTKDIHEHMVNYWLKQHEEYISQRIISRFDRAEGLGVIQKTNGDRILEQMTDLFLNGFGIEWSSTQIKIFRAFQDTILPRIYLEDWAEVKERVLKQRGLTKLQQECLVNMARRNGKTWIVSGACVAAFLTIKGISIAIFSVGKRQSGLFLTSCQEKLELAFNRGTHVKKSDFKQLQKNQEVLIYELPDGSKNTLASLPGSTKVS
jgi:hypothetical protein